MPGLIWIFKNQSDNLFCILPTTGFSFFFFLIIKEDRDMKCWNFLNQLLLVYISAGSWENDKNINQ